MVSITIFVEGGVVPHENDAAATIDNSHNLRESFYHLFTQFVENEEINIIVQPGGGYPKTIEYFKSEIEKNNSCALLIDSDCPKENIANRIKELTLENFENNTFFMIQEMEAWILSQPDKIEEYGIAKGFIREKNNELIADDNQIKDKFAEFISKPSRILNIIMQRYFSVLKNGKKKKKEYGKLKDAPGMLKLLNVDLLRSTFGDVQNLKLFITNQN